MTDDILMEKTDNTRGKTSLFEPPIPMCHVNGNGTVEDSNPYIDEVFLYDDLVDANFFAITGISVEKLEEVSRGEAEVKLERNGKVFKVVVNNMHNDGEDSFTIAFYDITELESLKKQYSNEKICVAVIDIDNFDELPSNASHEQRIRVTAQVRKTIRDWGYSLEGSISKIKDDEFIMYFPYGNLRMPIDDKFQILDAIRAIDTGVGFPISLSIGIGVDGRTIVETEELARGALDLALGRGGDQAVVKTVNETTYYGGKTQAIEKSNKGKSRVIAHALRELISHSEQIFIMGHTNADVDAFGASLGVHRICKLCNKEPYIVISGVNKTLSTIYNVAENTENYRFIHGDKAVDIINEDSLVIVLDTHRKSYVDCPPLLENAGNIVVIDHHRRAEDFIKNATLSYLESYASSTAELVTEMLQYSGQKKMLVKLEAEALLAGITIDTNRFAVKTGVRTFEAAAYLRRSGADTTEVKRFFQTDLKTFKVRSKCIAAADFYDEGIAMSVCEGENTDAQVINSQVADELLTIRGIKASFVAGKNEFGQTVISARSLGEVNVQIIMEKLGGGGHLTTAGAQSEDMSPEELLEEVKKIVLESEL